MTLKQFEMMNFRPEGFEFPTGLDTLVVGTDVFANALQMLQVGHKR